MTRMNENYLKLSGNYLFAEVGRRVAAYREAHPDADLIRLGIGDVTQPLSLAVLTAMHRAVDEMGHPETFRGYGPEQGYDFLIEKIIAQDFLPRGVKLHPAEVFVSDGSKCDVANFQQLLATDSSIAITDPVYPVYLDSNVMAGRTGVWVDGRFEKIVYLPCTAENHFLPPLPQKRVDVIYLCSPNNPTGTVLNRRELLHWVRYAQENRSLILFDAAYEAYIRDPEIPHSIYEIPGAEEVAVEFRSFSKTAGFTGMRCAFCVVPKAVRIFDSNGAPHSLNALWNRRQTTCFNGVSYPVQRAAEAVYSPEGRRETRALVDYYMGNAKIIREGLLAAGLEVYGGENAPYIWLRTPDRQGSMCFFDRLLNELQIVGTPGIGFGFCGEDYFRLTAFGNRERTREAIQRIGNLKRI